ncbi:Clp protease N-terminal domain-containing protein [Streptomyces sannanensis]|uniref:Clp protease N-terminal domain-containing protein n=1 Tax=Streptomyces sannanensis TaxID=285536 RepID=A0ABP6S5U4_9ACTN
MRTPTQRARKPASHSAAPDAGLTAELASVVAGARRRAQRDGDSRTDTAHLLHSLLESDPEVRAAFDGGQLAKVLGYLVQRSIGYGLRWQGTVEDSGAVPVVLPPAAAGCSPAAATALGGARRRAAMRGEKRANGLDLLAALAADPASRAVEVLHHAGVDTASLASRIGRLSQQVSP